MVNERGITDLRESGRGFVGAYVKYSLTRKKVPRLKFDLFFYKNDPDNFKFNIMRKAYVYGDLARQHKDLKSGQLIEFDGYVKRDVIRDAQFKPVFDDGQPVTQEHVFLDRLTVIDRDNIQPSLDHLLANQAAREPV